MTGDCDNPNSCQVTVVAVPDTLVILTVIPSPTSAASGIMVSKLFAVRQTTTQLNASSVVWLLILTFRIVPAVLFIIIFMPVTVCVGTVGLLLVTGRAPKKVVGITTTTSFATTTGFVILLMVTAPVIVMLPPFILTF